MGRVFGVRDERAQARGTVVVCADSDVDDDVTDGNLGVLNALSMPDPSVKR